MTKKEIDIDSFIDFIEFNYTLDEQNEVSLILLNENHLFKNTPIMCKLFEQGILEYSSEKFIEYRFRKFCELNKLKTIKQKKEFIISQIPSFKGLKGGKTASLDRMIDFIVENYEDLFDNLLSNFKTYSFSKKYKKIGRLAARYFYRKTTIKARYKYDENSDCYILKQDEVTDLLIKHNVQIDKNPPQDINIITFDIDLSPSLKTKTDNYSRRKFKEYKLFLMGILLSIILSAKFVLFLFPTLAIISIFLIKIIKDAINGE